MSNFIIPPESEFESVSELPPVAPSGSLVIFDNTWHISDGTQWTQANTLSDHFTTTGAVALYATNQIATPANQVQPAISFIYGEPCFWDINTTAWVPFRSYSS